MTEEEIRILREVATCELPPYAKTRIEYLLKDEAGRKTHYTYPYYEALSKDDLSTLIRLHRRYYYDKQPIISDEEYDYLVKKHKEISE